MMPGQGIYRTVLEAAFILNVSEKRVRRFLDEGALEADKVGKHVRITFTSLMRLKEIRQSTQALIRNTLSTQEVAAKLRVSERWVTRRCRPPYAKKVKGCWRIYPWAVEKFKAMRR